MTFYGPSQNILIYFILLAGTNSSKENAILKNKVSQVKLSSSSWQKKKDWFCGRLLCLISLFLSYDWPVQFVLRQSAG